MFKSHLKNVENSNRFHKHFSPYVHIFVETKQTI